MSDNILKKSCSQSDRDFFLSIKKMEIELQHLNSQPFVFLGAGVSFTVMSGLFLSINGKCKSQNDSF